MNVRQNDKNSRSHGLEAHPQGVRTIEENDHFRSEEKFLLLLNSIPSAVTYVDKDLYFRYVNRAFEKLFDRDFDSVVGKPMVDFLGKQAFDAVKCYIDAALSGKVVHYEMEVPLRAGTRCIEATYTPDFDTKGKVKGYIAMINDVTSKKETEKELERKRIELHDYMTSAAVALHWVDAKGMIIWANQAELDLLGYTEKEYIGHPIAEFHADKNKIRDILTRLSRNEILHQYEAELRCKDGTLCTVLINSNVLWEDGQFIHTRCFTTDITDRKRAEEALMESDSRSRDLLENLPVATYMTDAMGSIVQYNKAAAELWGRKPVPGEDKWCGSWQIFEPDGVTPISTDACPMAITLKEGRSIAGKEIVIGRPDGRKRNVKPYPVPMFDKNGKITGAVNMLLDITDQKTDEKELAHLAAIVHSSADPVISKTLNGIITSWNKAAERVFGYKADEIIGQSLLKLIPEEFQMEEPLILERLKKGEQVESFETKRITKDKKLLDVSLTISPVMDKEGNIIGASKIARDITAQKAIQKALQESEERLRMASESTQLGTWEYDPVASKLVWSDECRKIYGAPDEMNPTNEFVAGLTYPSDREYVKVEVARAMNPESDGKFHIQHRFFRASDRELRWLKVSGKVYFNSQRQPVRFIGNMLDITEEKHSEQLIKVSEERLRMAVEATRLGTWEFFPITGELTWSEECRKIYAIPPNEQLDFKAFADHVHPEDKDFVEREIQKSMDPAGDGSYDISYRILRFTTAEERWIRAQGRVYFNQERKAERFIGTVLDITDQKQSVRSVEESEQRSRLAIEAASMGTFNWDLQTQEVISSQRLRDIFGFHQHLRITHTDLINALHPEDKHLRDEAARDAIDKGLMSYEARILWPDWSIHWIRVYGKTIYDAHRQPLRMYGTVVDVTDEKVTLVALKESKARLDLAIDAAELGMWELDISSDIALYSDRYLEIMGFEKGSQPGHDELLSKVFPDDLSLREKALKAALKTGVLDFEMRVGTQLNNLHWIKVKGKVFYDDSGTPEKMIGTVLDITETKVVLSALQESEKRFRVIANTAPVMIWMSANDGFYDFFNTNWLNFTGRTIEQESNEGWLENVHPADVQKCIDDHHRSYVEQKELYTEYRLKRHDGKYRWIADNSMPRHNGDGSFAGFISACTDIDDQKNFREKIMESELLLKTISNASPVGLWMTDTLAQNTFVNDTWIEWTGLPFEKQLGTGWLERVLNEDKEEARTKLWNCLLRKEKYSTEFRILRSDGELRWCLTEGAPYDDIDGIFAGYAGSVTDITDLKKMEERKDDFIKMASHELKTPITSIKGYVQLLLKIYDELNEEQFQASKLTVKSSLDTVAKQVSKLTRLVSELLDLTRIESGKLELNKTEFSLGDLIEETVHDVRLTTSQHKIVVHNRFKGTLRADKDRIAQVLINLLTNAIKYSPDADDIEVEVSAEENSKMAVIKVRDHGIGIDKRDQEKIFQRFYRVEGKNEQTYPGFGIGLFICTEIVLRHDGTIAVESKKGTGSVFAVSLPIGQM